MEEWVWEGEAELGRTGDENDPCEVLGVGKNKTCAAVLLRAILLAACVSGLVQVPMWLLGGAGVAWQGLWGGSRGLWAPVCVFPPPLLH